MNDAVSYIRGLAEAHGRNADWAEKAVREAATLTATEALEMNVIDLIAADEAELL
ncbi:MAG: nodulation protein NfeD, partial [Woeseiaceae bacterium]|nr:nodulation protein NfeD [Woeseiaceae bacterium]